MSEGRPNGYEKKDVDFSIVAMFLGVLLVMMLLVGVAARIVFRMVSAPPALTAQGPAAALPPEPRLEADPVGHYKAFRAKEDDLLTHYGWVDRPKGIVRIPIDRAMDLIAAKGLPSREKKL